jgi:hypothetical protein
MFDTTLDGFKVHGGASATSDCGLIRNLLPEQHQALQKPSLNRGVFSCACVVQYELGCHLNDAKPDT